MAAQAPLRMIAVGAAVQDVFLSQSEEFKPVENGLHEQTMELTLGGKANVNHITFSTGGGATNAAVTFARQGLEAAFMGAIGNDPAGRAVLDDLDAEGVDTTGVSYDQRYHTGYSVLLLAPNGERTILTYRGASTHYQPSYFNLDHRHADWLYVSTLNGNFSILSSLFHDARARGIKICFNPGKGELSQPKKLKALLEDVEVVCLNRDEAALLVEGQSMEELARHMHHLVPVVVVSDGPNGVVATDGKTVVRAGMYEDVKVIDRTGAGDAFGSGFLARWASGDSLQQAVVFASANATSVVRQIGAKHGILSTGVRLHDMPIHEKNY